MVKPNGVGRKLNRVGRKRRDETGSEGPHQRPRLLLRVLSFLAIALCIGVIAGFLISFIVEAFSISLGQGIQSLCAGALPLIVISYITYFTPLLQPPRIIPTFNIYFVFALWTLALFILSALWRDGGNDIPVAEMLFSFTLSMILSISNRISFEAFLACAYGVLTGFLLYVALSN
ncbi:hypothetical protein H6F88_14330 [Oculatella sp. FACHB-28]|uniref:hypothetical protein n=1 Tax=Cyanophyceae TaxID=3028117 RepID=UPI001683FE67|nr:MULTISPECIES: hypothetical protein [Cyanophyceae]MBD1996020.1 hypothetical protein [Leptolyngbya sp. FACHB-541]MBD2057180.1 hypothetical protein [Oculatella sp. FACHB-28]